MTGGWPAEAGGGLAREWIQGHRGEKEIALWEKVINCHWIFILSDVGQVSQKQKQCKFCVL